MQRQNLPKKMILAQMLLQKPLRPFKKMKFKLSFKRNTSLIHETEVRDINLLDLRRHLETGETVEIIPEFPSDTEESHQRDRSLWYFVHS
jgi:hypothetical protein